MTDSGPISLGGENPKGRFEFDLYAQLFYDKGARKPFVVRVWEWRQGVDRFGYADGGWAWRPPLADLRHEKRFRSIHRAVRFLYLTLLSVDVRAIEETMIEEQKRALELLIS